MRVAHLFVCCLVLKIWSPWLLYAQELGKLPLWSSGSCQRLGFATLTRAAGVQFPVGELQLDVLPYSAIGF